MNRRLGSFGLQGKQLRKQKKGSYTFRGCFPFLTQHSIDFDHQLLDKFRRSIGSTSRSYARRLVVWPEASTRMVLECNPFEIGFGFPRDCFDLGRIVSAAVRPPRARARSGSLPAGSKRRKVPVQTERLRNSMQEPGSILQQTSRCFPSPFT